MTVLLGRATAQAGFFAFAIGPSLVLSDPDYNDLIVGVTVVLLTVVAPVGAFQLHLARVPKILDQTRSALKKTLLLATSCSIGGFALISVLNGVSVTGALLVLGGVANIGPTFGSTIHALNEKFVVSALLDATSGILLTIATIVLVVVDAPLQAWATGYLGVWLVASGAATIGPLAISITQNAGSLGGMVSVLRASAAMLSIGVVAMAFNRTDYLALTVVGTPDEAARYAIASRVVGPIYIALGSLNNSLYVRQIGARDDDGEIDRLTSTASRSVGLLALAFVPVVAGAVAVLGVVSESFADRALVGPSVLLALATIPFAFAIPFGFGLAAKGRETKWLMVLLVATLVDLALVLAVTPHDAPTVAVLWLIVQIGVVIATRRVWNRSRAPASSTGTRS